MSDAERLFRLVLVILASWVILAGCAPKQWIAPAWMSDQEARLAADECQREAAALVGQSSYNALIAIQRGRQCMAARGFTQE